MNKKYLLSALSLVVLSNSMLFLGVFLRQSIEQNAVQWLPMILCLVPIIASFGWNIWVMVSADDEKAELRYELIDTKDKLKKALKYAPPPMNPVSASASSLDKKPRKRGALSQPNWLNQ